MLIHEGAVMFVLVCIIHTCTAAQYGVIPLLETTDPGDPDAFAQAMVTWKCEYDTHSVAGLQVADCSPTPQPEKGWRVSNALNNKCAFQLSPTDVQNNTVCNEYGVLAAQTVSPPLVPIISPLIDVSAYSKIEIAMEVAFEVRTDFETNFTILLFDDALDVIPYDTHYTMDPVSIFVFEGQYDDRSYRSMVFEVDVNSLTELRFGVNRTWPTTGIFITNISVTTIVTASPTLSPTTSLPTTSPTASPSTSPTTSPTLSPTSSSPTGVPTTSSPTTSPTTSLPTTSPTSSSPSVAPISSAPSKPPSKAPTAQPSVSPTMSAAASASSAGVGGIVGGAVVVIIIIVLLVIAFVFREKFKKKLFAKDIPQYDPNEAQSEILMQQFRNRNDEDMELYTDPGNYADPTELNAHVRKFCTVLRKDDLTFTTLLGAGEFGEVTLGTLRQKQGGQMTCACKTLRKGSTPAERMDFMTEAAIMGQFIHPNVVSLIGVVLSDGEEVIVIELMQNGELQGYLEKDRANLDLPILIKFGLDVAQGMFYLSTKGFVHRDLAARNVLVNAERVCKVADFGLSQSLDDDSEYFKSEGGKVPIRWTAPEALASRKYTTSSDVWSYGVLLWEIMTYGQRPYGDMGNLEVFQKVQDGYRLENPTDCPKQIHALMLRCWELERRARITFEELAAILAEFEGDATKNGYLTIDGNDETVLAGFRERKNTGGFGFDTPPKVDEPDSFDYAVAQVDNMYTPTTPTHKTNNPDSHKKPPSSDEVVLAPSETYGQDDGFTTSQNEAYESTEGKMGFTSSTPQTPTPKPRTSVVNMATPVDYDNANYGVPQDSKSTTKPGVDVIIADNMDYGVPQDTDAAPPPTTQPTTTTTTTTPPTATATTTTTTTTPPPTATPSTTTTPTPKPASRTAPTLDPSDNYAEPDDSETTKMLSNMDSTL